MIELEKVSLPHPALPSANWADRYAMVTAGRPSSALDVCRVVLSQPPGWFHLLIGLRNRIVGLFGLKPARRENSASTIGIFPVVSRREDQVVLGFDDWHLDFRLVVDIAAIADGRTRIALTTLVDRHNLFGRAYIFVITPFHKLIVRAMLSRYQSRSTING